jgi:hypothetical protein
LKNGRQTEKLINENEEEDQDKEYCKKKKKFRRIEK